MNTQELFITILKSILHNTDINETHINYDELLDLSNKQNLTGLITYKLKQCPASYHSIQAATIVNTKRKEMACIKIEEIFKKNHIHYALIKGLDLAKYYPNPYLRSMSDLDFYVDKQDITNADMLLKELGYTKTKDANEWIYMNNSIEVECHPQLIYESVYEKEIFNQVNEYITNNRLDTTFHLLFLIAHLKKHILYEGVGFRQFLDIALLYKYGNIDLNKFKELCNKAQLYEFTQTVFSLLNYWFDLESPFIKVLEIDFIVDVTDKIFKDGVFGHDNDHNKLEKIASSHLSDSPVKTRMKYILSRLFPSQKDLKRLSYLSFFHNKPYLYPFALIYRFIYVLFHKDKRNTFILKATLSDNEIQNRKQFLTQWGIDEK